MKIPSRVAWNDHYVVKERAYVELREGTYPIEIERGPEYEAGRELRVNGGEKSVRHRLKRIVDLEAEGWWSGDLHVHRPLADIELLMRAEDLHVAPVITWWNNQEPVGREGDPRRARWSGSTRDRFYHVMAGEDEREGGALLYFDLPEAAGDRAGRRASIRRR